MTARRYAEGTTVGTDKTIAELRALLTKHGATHYAYGSGPDGEMVQFTLGGNHYRFEVKPPDAEAREFTYTPTGWMRSRDQVLTLVNGEVRRRWRARLLWLKALLEFGKDVPLEQSMLANLVLPDGRTFADWAGPQIESMYANGQMPPLLTAGK